MIGEFFILEEKLIMKFSITTLNKIMECCTKKEIDLLIYIGQFQNGYGEVMGIRYQDVIKNINICKSTFYQLLSNLEAKGIIQINSLSIHGYWSITILDNIFLSEADWKKGYVKLNYEILYTDAFREMTKAEKLIILNLIKLNGHNSNYIKITSHRLMEWTGKSLRSVKKFVSTISMVFRSIFKAPVNRDGNLYYFSIQAFKLRDIFEKDILLEQIINYSERITKSEASDNQEKKDAIAVLKPLLGKFNNGTELIMDIVGRTLKNLGRLIPRYVNTLTQTAIVT